MKKSLKIMIFSLFVIDLEKRKKKKKKEKKKKEKRKAYRRSGDGGQEGNQKERSKDQ